MRTIALLISLALSASAFGQAAVQTSLALDVQRLAPQLVAFAGGEANFQNLVNGLATGAAVTLTTTTPAGGTQAASFTPTGTMTAPQIAQALEKLRQSLISRGIAAPNAQQLATALTGGALPTPAGTTQVNGAIATKSAATSTQQVSPAVAIQNTFSQAATGGSAPTIGSQTSDSRFPRGISDTPSNVMAPQTPAPIATPARTASMRTTK